MLSLPVLLVEMNSKMNLEMAFFNPWKDEEQFFHEEKQKILRSVFIVAYLGELKKKLRFLIHNRCYMCNPSFTGDNLCEQSHKCVEYTTLEKAVEHYGERAMAQISLNNETRWKICRSFWDFIYELKPGSTITDQDAMVFIQKDNFDLIRSDEKWICEFNVAVRTVFWSIDNIPDNDSELLLPLTKW
jgi:hypothetical protein